MDIPVLGVCYGLQLLIHNMDGKISKGNIGEYGNAKIEHFSNNILFDDVPNEINVWMSHADKVVDVTRDWDI